MVLVIYMSIYGNYQKEDGTSRLQGHGDLMLTSMTKFKELVLALMFGIWKCCVIIISFFLYNNMLQRMHAYLILIIMLSFNYHASCIILKNK